MLPTLQLAQLLAAYIDFAERCRAKPSVPMALVWPTTAASS
eukprot:COSAG02_NODE_1422_length_12685_cov_69.610361_13_plen_41_part_00